MSNILKLVHTWYIHLPSNHNFQISQVPTKLTKVTSQIKSGARILDGQGSFGSHIYQSRFIYFSESRSWSRSCTNTRQSGFFPFIIISSWHQHKVRKPNGVINILCQTRTAVHVLIYVAKFWDPLKEHIKGTPITNTKWDNFWCCARLLSLQ